MSKQTLKGFAPKSLIIAGVSAIGLMASAGYANTPSHHGQGLAAHHFQHQQSGVPHRTGHSGIAAQALANRGYFGYAVPANALGAQGHGLPAQGYSAQGFGTQGLGTQGLGTQGLGAQGFGAQGFGAQGYGAAIPGAYAAAPQQSGPLGASIYGGAGYDAFSGLPGYAAPGAYAVPGAVGAPLYGPQSQFGFPGYGGSVFAPAEPVYAPAERFGGVAAAAPAAPKKPSAPAARIPAPSIPAPSIPASAAKPGLASGAKPGAALGGYSVAVPSEEKGQYVGPSRRVEPATSNEFIDPYNALQQGFAPQNLQGVFPTEAPSLQGAYTTVAPSVQSGYVAAAPSLQGGYVAAPSTLQSGFSAVQPGIQGAFAAPTQLQGSFAGAVPSEPVYQPHSQAGGFPQQTGFPQQGGFDAQIGGFAQPNAYDNYISSGIVIGGSTVASAPAVPERAAPTVQEPAYTGFDASAYAAQGAGYAPAPVPFQQAAAPATPDYSNYVQAPIENYTSAPSGLTASAGGYEFGPASGAAEPNFAAAPAYKAPAPQSFAAAPSFRNTPSASHFVQVAAFVDPARAERLASRLQGQGEQAFIVQARVRGRTFHRVRVPASGGRDARFVRDRIRNLGHYEARVVRG